MHILEEDLKVFLSRATILDRHKFEAPAKDGKVVDVVGL